MVCSTNDIDTVVEVVTTGIVEHNVILTAYERDTSSLFRVGVQVVITGVVGHYVILGITEANTVEAVFVASVILHSVVITIRIEKDTMLVVAVTDVAG